jgi:hypothetical protein
MYGLPVAEDIGKWNFTIVARNSANLSVSELAEIQVRQHQAERTFHHKFRLQIEPEFSEEELAFPRVIIFQNVLFSSMVIFSTIPF